MPASQSPATATSLNGPQSLPTSKPSSQEGPVFEFESAVEAVVNSDLAALEDAIRRNPALVRARSSRICCFDPADAPRHLAPLRRRQWGRRIPPKDDPNAVEIARALLQAGAEPDALADMYGAEPECTTMSMLVSSNHPAEAGLQVPLLELLLDFGAAIEGRGTRKWSGPLFTALAFGISDAVKLLAKRKARIDLPTAAGMGLAPAGSRPPTPKRATARSPWLRNAEMRRLFACCSSPERTPTATTRKAPMPTRHPCTSGPDGQTRRRCAWSHAAHGWIPGTASMPPAAIP
jgi:hypothetical protein